MVVKEPKSTKKVDMPEMTEQNLKAALDAQMNKKDDDLKLTKEEADKVSSSPGLVFAPGPPPLTIFPLAPLHSTTNTLQP